MPLQTLAAGTHPAFVFRRAFDPDHCAGLIDRFYDRGLLYDPRKPDDPNTKRVDIGTSLGSHRAEPDRFFEHAAKTRAMFSSLFEGFDDPVRCIYRILENIGGGKKVMTAREPDGRVYGPAIFRCYFEGVGHRPHYDSARKRSKIFNFEVSRFERQFAGVLCFQNAEEDKEHGQAFLYHKQWSEDIGDELPRFRSYAAEQGIDRVRIDLNPGDFYVFCSETIHEVPPPRGDQPRIVLAVFFAMSDDDDEIYVWS